MQADETKLTAETQPQKASEEPGSTQSLSDAAQTPRPIDFAQLLSYVLYPLLLSVTVLFCTVRPLFDYDIWFHLAFGKYFEQNAALPYADVFSHTAAGREAISSGWFSSVMNHYLFEIFGSDGTGLLLMVFAVVAVTLLAIYFTSIRRYGGIGAIAVCLFFTLLVSYIRFNPRPDIWGHFFMVALVLLTVTADDSVRAQQGKLPRRLWLIPVVVTLWANFHAGYLAAFPLLGIYMVWCVWRYFKAAERWRLVALIPCVLGFVSWVVNPYGAKLALLPVRVGILPGQNPVSEWMPLFSRNAPVLPLAVYVGLAGLLLFAAIVVCLSWRTLPWWHLAVIVVFTVMGFTQRRNLNFAAFVIPAVLLPHMAGLENLLRKQRHIVPDLAIVLAAAICFLQYKGALETGRGWPSTGRNGSLLPVIATDFLAQNPPPSPLFNDYGAGGYLMYHLYPKTKVFIDGRQDVYGQKIWKDYSDFIEGRTSSDGLVERYKVGTFLLKLAQAFEYADHPAYRLAQRPDYQIVYYDDSFVIFVHRTPETQEYLKQWGVRWATPFKPQRIVMAMRNPDMREAVVAEAARMVEISGGSANACALAALALFLNGDKQGAQEFLQAAFARDPAGPVVQKVAAALTGKQQLAEKDQDEKPAPPPTPSAQ